MMKADTKARRAPQPNSVAPVGGRQPRGDAGGLLPDATASKTNIRSTTAQRHPIIVREGVQNVEVLIGRNRGGLTPSQRADVLSFAQAWRHEAGSGIIIDVPHGGPTDHAAADAMREIRSIFAAIGVPSNAIYVRHYRPGRSALASIKLNYSKLVADAGPCGQWPRDLGPSFESALFENQPYWNFGCASQRNLAAMVDNPADLVQPRGEIPPYAPRRTVVIEHYTQGRKPLRHLRWL